MRAALVLRYWLDLSVGETAALMNCSEGTVKSHPAKDAARLRELLRPAVAAKDPAVNDVTDPLELALSDTGVPPADQRPDPAATWPAAADCTAADCTAAGLTAGGPA